MDKKNENLLADHYSTIMVFIVFVAAAIAGTAIYFYHKHFPSDINSDHPSWGQFGDFFGGTLNPVFGFLGLIALLITISIQQRELRASLEELRDTKIELKKSNESYRIQNRTMEKQSFEETLFKMLDRFSHIISTFQVSGEHYGRQAFEQINKKYRSDVANKQYKYKTANPENLPSHHNICAEVYGEYVDKEHGGQLDTYFRSLYHIFKFIENGEFTREEKYKYASIVRSQISGIELALIFYNGAFHEEGRQGLRPLIERYALLKHIRKNELVDSSLIDRDDLYHPNAFRKHLIVEIPEPMLHENKAPYAT